MPESFSREVPEGSKAPAVYGKRNPQSVIEARQRRLYRRQLEGLPARHLVIDHADRENVSEATAWKDWKAVQTWNEEDFALEKPKLLSRLQAMRLRAIDKALRKGQLQSAAQMMDALGRVIGEAAPETLALEAPNLTIKVEKPAE